MKSSIPECSSKTLSPPSFSPSSFFGALFPLLLPLSSWLIYVVAALCLSMRHHRKLVLTGFHHHLHHHHHHQHYHHHYSSLQSQRQPGPILSMFPCSIAVPDKVPEKGKIIWNLSDRWQSFGKPPQIQDGGNGEKLRRLVKISWIRMRRPLTIDVNASLWIFQRFMIQVWYLYFIIWHKAVSSAVCDWIIFWPLMIIWPSPLRPTKEITTGLNWTDTGL